MSPIEFNKGAFEGENLPEQKKQDSGPLNPSEISRQKESIKEIRFQEIYDILKESDNDFNKEKINSLLSTLIQKQDQREEITNNLIDLFQQTGGEIDYGSFKRLLNKYLKENQASENEVKINEDKVKISEYKVKTNEDKVKTSENEIKAKNMSEKIEKYNQDVLKLKETVGVLGSGKVDKVKNIINRLGAVDTSKIENYEEFLSGIDELKTILQDPGMVEDIARDLMKYDSSNGTKYYENFKEVMVSLNLPVPTLVVDSKNKVRLGVDNLDNTKFSSDGGIEKKIKGNNDSTYQLKVGNNGERSLNIEGSNYLLESGKVNETRIKEIDNVQNSFNEAIKPIDKILSGIDKVLLIIQNGEQKNQNIDEIKNNIKNQEPELYSSLGIENFKDIDSLKNHLAGKYDEKEKEKKKMEQEAKGLLDKLVKIEEKENKNKYFLQQEALKVMHEIYLDRIPQELLDQIIKNINGDLALLGKLGFQKPINIKDGILGIDKDNNSFEYTIPEKQILVKLLNKILTGNQEQPLIINSTGIMFVDEQGNKTTGVNIEKYILSKLGGKNNIYEIMNRLNQTNNSTKKEKN